MRSRALIQIVGTPGGGKTTLIERLLESGFADCLVARAVRDT
jgi:predicted ATPase